MQEEKKTFQALMYSVPENWGWDSLIKAFYLNLSPNWNKFYEAAKSIPENRKYESVVAESMPGDFKVISLDQLFFSDPSSREKLRIQFRDWLDQLPAPSRVIISRFVVRGDCTYDPLGSMCPLEIKWPQWLERDAAHVMEEELNARLALGEGCTPAGN